MVGWWSVVHVIVAQLRPFEADVTNAVALADLLGAPERGQVH